MLHKKNHVDFEIHLGNMYKKSHRAVVKKLFLDLFIGPL